MLSNVVFFTNLYWPNIGFASGTPRKGLACRCAQPLLCVCTCTHTHLSTLLFRAILTTRIEPRHNSLKVVHPADGAELDPRQIAHAVPRHQDRTILFECVPHAWDVGAHHSPRAEHHPGETIRVYKESIRVTTHNMPSCHITLAHTHTHTHTHTKPLYTHLVTFRWAELGFLGFIMNTRWHSPLRWGLPISKRALPPMIRG
jgi:hypothetical protein